VVILKDTSVRDLKLLLNFIYRGEVFVQKEEAKQFLSLAESLQVTGLLPFDLVKPRTSQNQIDFKQRRWANRITAPAFIFL
jgi:hypothetical protein